MLSTGAGVAVWTISGEPLAAPATLAAGLLIDADHLLDQAWRFYLRRRPAALLVLHAWEWLAALLVASILLSFPWWMAAISVGYSLHLLTDQAFNHTRPWGYSLLYMAWHRFEVERFSTGWRLDRPGEALRKELGLTRDAGGD